MRNNSSKAIIGLSFLLALGASSANATWGSGHSSGCGPGHDSTPDTTSCDTWQGTHTYDMYLESTHTENVEIGAFDAANSAITVDGIGIQVQAWSDTGNYNGSKTFGFPYYQAKDGSGYHGEEDTSLDEGTLAGPWTGKGGEVGYGIYNKDYDDHHAIDNLASDFGEVDYDMVLLSFSEAVTLTGATFSWLIDDASTQQVSVAGFSSIVDASSWSTVASTMSQPDLMGSFQIEECDDVYESAFTSVSGAAQYWLVGAYNSAFGYIDNLHNDAFKLASIGFNKETDPGDPGTEPVNAPGTFALLALSGAFAAWRRRK